MSLLYEILSRSAKLRFLARKITGRETFVPFEMLVGMTSNEERNFISRYAKESYTGRGEVVDLGSWMGSTVVPFAKGLSLNPAVSNRKVHAYDSFRWHSYLDVKTIFPPLKTGFKEGDSFRSEFEKAAASCSGFIEVHEGDILRQKWSREPIEYLLVDIMKTWEIARYVVKEFYPYLMPGENILIHQDFCHYYTSWIHLIQHRMKDYFEPVQNIPFSTSMVYRNIKPIPAATISLLPESLSEFTRPEVDKAFEYSLSLVMPRNRPSVLAAKAMFYYHSGDYAEALKIIKTVPFTARLRSGDLKQAEQIVRGMIRDAIPTEQVKIP